MPTFDENMKKADAIILEDQVSATPTPHRIRCRRHGDVYLMPSEYERQMLNANDLWRCPHCGRPAEWCGANVGDSSRDEANHREIVRLAKDQYEDSSCDIEIDDDAIVSEGGENGAFVAAWVWVSFAGTRFDKEGGGN